MVRRKIRGGVSVAAVFAVVLGTLAGCDGDGAGPIGGSGAAPATSSDLVIPPGPVPPPPPSPAAVSAPASGMPGMPGAPDAGVTYHPQAKVDELLNANPIRFDPDSVALSDAGKAMLKQVAEAVHCPPESRIEVTAAARFEDPQKSMTVSQQRADAVAQELVANGITAQRISAKGVGNQGVAADDSSLSVRIRVV